MDVEILGQLVLRIDGRPAQLGPMLRALVAGAGTQPVRSFKGRLGYVGLMRAELRANDFPPAAETRFYGSRPP